MSTAPRSVASWGLITRRMLILSRTSHRQLKEEHHDQTLHVFPKKLNPIGSAFLPEIFALSMLRDVDNWESPWNEALVFVYTGPLADLAMPIFYCGHLSRIDHRLPVNAVLHNELGSSHGRQ